jgi:hypothetical protein
MSCNKIQNTTKIYKVNQIIWTKDMIWLHSHKDGTSSKIILKKQIQIRHKAKLIS